MAKSTKKRVRSTKPTSRRPISKRLSIPAESSEPAPGGATIVGIGASAGGLEAARSLLQHLSRTTGLSYVVVQHLAPRHESVLPELLNASSSLPVVQATEGMALMPNRVHVIPPNTVMTVLEGRLHLAQRPTDRSAYAPIDTFFSSLADYAKDRAVGIVLSGSASDGSNGLKDIKAVGGITIAQDPTSAKYDGMPRAAIATGAVDLVLTPEQIAHELTRVGSHPFVSHPPRPADHDNGFTEDLFDQLFSLLRGASGVDFSNYKLPTIKRRLQRRMVLHKATRLDEYLRVLENHPEEVKNLYRDILIHVTRFFREPASFDALKKTVFPRIFADAAGQRPLRIWVPGCATGEEAYSIAITLLEFLGQEANNVALQVFATDVSEEAVERARLGTYPESISGDVSPERLRQFFARVDGHYRVSKLVRDSCIFARQDLTRDPPFSKLDLIVCRNVLIYLGPQLQRKLMAVFHYALKSGGYLMLGGTESVGTHVQAFSVVDKRNKIFGKRAGQLRKEFEFTAASEGAFERKTLERGLPAPTAHRSTDLQAEVSRLLLGRYTPPSVVVDGDFQIVQTRGRTGPYLELATGEPSLNLLKMAREGLLHGLRSALHEARKSTKPARRVGLTVRVNGSSREVDVQVLPVGGGESQHFVVLFETPQRASTPQRPPRESKNKRTVNDTRLERLQHELSSSREYLQTIIQDLETANEELQSANEEILSSNEELQSTNEELDTAKEELQSTNEELNTVNEELNARNEELSHVNSDLINLLSAVPAAVVIVSSDLRIRRFTPMAEQVLNLIPTDVGRPLGDIRPNIDPPELAELTREVIDTVTTKELAATDRTGHNYAIRIRPYKDQENRIDGAVLAFVDVDEARRHSSLAANERLDSLVSCFTQPVVVLDDELRVSAINDAALAVLGAKARREVEGQEYRSVGQHQLSAQSLADPLERLRTRGEPFSELLLESPGGAFRPLQVDGRRLSGTAATSPLLVLTIRDASPVG